MFHESPISEINLQLEEPAEIPSPVDQTSPNKEKYDHFESIISNFALTHPEIAKFLSNSSFFQVCFVGGAATITGMQEERKDIDILFVTPTNPESVEYKSIMLLTQCFPSVLESGIHILTGEIHKGKHFTDITPRIKSLFKQ